MRCNIMALQYEQKKTKQAHRDNQNRTIRDTFRQRSTLKWLV